MTRRSKWLVLALVLFALVAGLGADRMAPLARRHAKPVFRHGPTRQEHAKMVQRRTLPALPVESPSGHERGTPAQHRDPLLVALPASAEAVLVLEADAFFEMPIGKLIWRCLAKRVGDHESDLVTPGKFERIAFAVDHEQPLVIMTGDFNDDMGDGFEEIEHYGDHAKFFRARTSQRDGTAGSREREVSALWNQRMLIHAGRGDDLRSVIDRLEGTQPARPSVGPNEAYGEFYGRMDAETLAIFLPRELRKRLEVSDTRFNFHLDGSDEALLVVDATGDPDTTQDVGRAFAGALTVLRVKAKTEGNEALAELLDAHAVLMTHDGFRLEAAFPVETVRRFLGACADESPADVADGGT